jgi:ABC-2 type transport system permease protein
METVKIPSASAVLSSLLRADFTTQWRNRKSVLLLLLIPIVIVLSWKGMIAKTGGAFVLANSITIGLNAIGLMGYSNSVARDRDKGIFQRLRVAPLTAWSIMASRLLVQLAMILLVTTAVFIFGYYSDNILLTPAGYAVGLLMSVVGGAMYLGLGQAIVGLIKNPETVNAVSRLIYIVFIMVGMLAELGALGPVVGNASKWSPYGTVKHILSTGMQPATWNQHTTMAFLMTLGYALAFSAIGIKWFRWSSK